jgi:signal transduction histidine kinase
VATETATRRSLGIPLSVPQFAALVCAVGILYALGAESAFWFAGSVETGVAFFPAAGLTLAVLAVTKRNRWIFVLTAVAVAEVTVDLRHGQTVWMALGFALANTAEPYVGASLLRGTALRERSLRAHFFHYLLCATVAGPLVGGAIGGATTTLAGTSETWAWIATKWAIGDALGVLVIGTCLLSWVGRFRFNVDPTVPWRDYVAFPLLAGAVTVTTVLLWDQPVIYIVLPVLMWAAVRGGFSLTTTTGVAVALVAEFAVAFGHAGNAVIPDHSAATQLLYLQLFLAVALLSALVLALEVAERIGAERALRKREEEQLLERLAALDGALDERRRIARDVHDIVGHALNAVVLQAGGARRVFDDDPPLARELVQSIETTSRDAFGDLDAALGLVDNSPELTPGRSIADVASLVDTLRHAGLDVDLTIGGDRRALPRLVEWSAYRIVQEALTNVLKHVDRGRANVCIAYELDTLAVAIVNDGHTRNGKLKNGRGVIGMRERASVLGGSIEIGPDANGGFAVKARIPIGQP